MHLGTAGAVSELAHRLLDRGLHLEYQPRRRPQPHVKRAPVQPAFGAGVLVDRERRLCEVQHLAQAGDEFQAAEGDDRVAGHLAGDLYGGLCGQLVEELLQVAAVASPGHLDDAGMVAYQHELHGTLQAKGFYPASDSDGFTDVVAQVSDQGPDHRVTP
jgi:hypothetical protein